MIKIIWEEDWRVHMMVLASFVTNSLCRGKCQTTYSCMHRNYWLFKLDWDILKSISTCQHLLGEATSTYIKNIINTLLLSENLRKVFVGYKDFYFWVNMLPVRNIIAERTPQQKKFQRKNKNNEICTGGLSCRAGEFSEIGK